MDVNTVSGQVVDAAMKVHSALGPGLLERAYQICLGHELGKRRIRFRSQVILPVVYDNLRIKLGYRVDLLVEESVLVELKAVTRTLPVHEAQLLSYLRLSGHHVGLLINFHVPRLKDGIKRIAN
jgi:GxxExxY protein